MSVASEEWLEGKYRDTYTLDQIKKLAAAVREGKTDYPPEKADEILREFGWMETDRTSGRRKKRNASRHPAGSRGMA